MREKLIELNLRKKEADQAFIDACKEIDALRSQPSNIPADMLGLRKRIAGGDGIPEAALPFAGELLQVKLRNETQDFVDSRNDVAGHGKVRSDGRNLATQLADAVVDVLDLLL